MSDDELEKAENAHEVSDRGSMPNIDKHLEHSERP